MRTDLWDRRGYTGVAEILLIIARSLVERRSDNLPTQQQAQPKRRYPWVKGTSNLGTHPAPAGSYMSLELQATGDQSRAQPIHVVLN